MPEATRRGTRSGPAAWLLAIAAVLMGAVVAAGPSGRDETRVREVVRQQLKAMATDDAATAFALAAPGIRLKFGNAEHYMAMARSHYPMVFHPASVQFLAPDSDGTLAFQRVRMTDTAGATWRVTYLLSRQQGQDWRISACLVAPGAQDLTI